MLKKFNQVEFKDPVGFMKQFMNREVSCLGTKGYSKELYKMEGFYRKKDEARELLSKEKKGLFSFFFFGCPWHMEFPNQTRAAVVVPHTGSFNPLCWRLNLHPGTEEMLLIPLQHSGNSRKGLFLGRDVFFWGQVTAGILSCRLPLFPLGHEAGP